MVRYYLVSIRMATVLVVGLMAVVAFIGSPHEVNADSLTPLVLDKTALLMQGTTSSESVSTTGAGFSCVGVSEVPQSECEALLVFYESTNGDGWLNNDGWLQTTTPCSWYGVTCEGGHITRLGLGRNQLRGPLPPELDQLTQLVYINFFENQLTGTIPPELGSLSSLDFLHLYKNSLSGPIPPELGNLSRLRELSILGNRLSGPIPTELCWLSDLRKLHLEANQLAGTIPSCLGELHFLIELGLDENNLSGQIPEELCGLIDLTSLTLSKNPIEGPIPSCTNENNLWKLTNLWLEGTQLSGPLPDSMLELKMLIRLLIADTNLCIPNTAEWSEWFGKIRDRDVNLAEVLCTIPTPTFTPTPTSTSEPVESTPTFTPTATPTPTLTPTSHPTPKPYVLILMYAVLDNNLGIYQYQLFNNTESGVHDNIHVRLMLDGPEDADAKIYDVMHDDDMHCPNLRNPTCGDRYQLGTNMESFTETSADPGALREFLVDSIQQHPEADQIVLALIGHGSGWSANALPITPTGWVDLNGDSVTEKFGGMLWDDRPTETIIEVQSISTRAIGSALQSATSAVGRQIDLLYLDGCSMAAVEVAYELREYAHYMLASPNTDWASFTYNNLLPATTPDVDARTLGESWLSSEAASLRSNRGHPFTLSLVDLQKMQELADATSGLAQKLKDIPTDNKAKIHTAFEQSERYDSNYDNNLDIEDTYLDFADFLDHLAIGFATDTALTQLITNTQEALSSAVVAEDHENGTLWMNPEQEWNWDTLGGLSIYLPLGSISDIDAAKLNLYNEENLAWAQDTMWDDFILAYQGSALIQTAQVSPLELPTCTQTASCPELSNPLQPGSSHAVYLPLIVFR